MHGSNLSLRNEMSRSLMGNAELYTNCKSALTMHARNEVLDASTGHLEGHIHEPKMRMNDVGNLIVYTFASEFVRSELAYLFKEEEL